MQKFLQMHSRWIVALAVLCGVAFAACTAHSAHALSNVGPDPGDFSGGNFGYIVSSSNNGDVSIPNTYVNLYFKNNTGDKTATVTDVNLCTDTRGTADGGSGGNYRDYGGETITNGIQTTRYYVTSAAGGGYTSSQVYGVYSSSNTCYSNTHVITIPGSQLVFDNRSGYYVATFHAEIMASVSHGQNVFGVRLGDTDAIVGYDAGQTASSFGVAKQTPSSGYRNYYLRFAPDCTVTAPTTANAYWYDDDNGAAGVQPDPMNTEVRKYDLNGNYLSTVSPLTFTGATKTTSLGGGVYEVYSGSKKTVKMSFTVEPGYKYIWFWHNVYYVNIMQFQMPFDSIYYASGCVAPAGNITPSSTVDKPTMSYPDTATFNHYVNVSNFDRTGSVKYSIQRYRDGAATGGPQTGTYNFTGNGQSPSVQTNTFTSTDADAGAKICERMTLSDPVPSAQQLAISGNPSEACTVVAAHPYLTVTNNDVWAGSRFDYNNNQCSGQPARNSNISSWVAGGGGAVGQYGVTASGTISQFGSANLAGGTGLTFANVPSLGSLGASTRCVPDYYHTVGTAGATAWGGIGSIPTGGGQKKYTASGPVTIGAGTVPKGAQAVLLVNGDVNITGDVKYSDSYGSQSDISSLWIIATGNINIQENVQQVAGFYVAEGTSDTTGIIQTCVQNGQSVTYNPLTTQKCNSSLDVYGALLANQVYWQRTKGTAWSGQPYAESVQFDPELYLSTPYSSTTNSLTTQDTVELPPIY